MKFKPHRWTLNAFDDGSAIWLLEWVSSEECVEWGWSPVNGFEGSRRGIRDLKFNFAGGVHIHSFLAWKILKSWRGDRRVKK